MKSFRKFTAAMIVSIVGWTTPLFALQSASLSYLFDLSDFNGTVLLGRDGKLFADRKHDEVYVAKANTISVFNASGMQFYRFEIHPRYGRVQGIAVDSSGEIVVLAQTRSSDTSELSWDLLLCNFRGEPQRSLDVGPVPEQLDSFLPNEMVYSNSHLYLVDSGRLQIGVTHESGPFVDTYDLSELLQIEDSEGAEITGFDVDDSGNLLLTIAVRFKVYVISPDGRVRSFGDPGSTTGKFGILGGIAADDHGNLVVVDRLRSAMMIFDKESLQFIHEYVAVNSAGQLLVYRPRNLKIGSAGMVYVTQGSVQSGVAALRLFSWKGSPSGDPNTNAADSSSKTGLAMASPITVNSPAASSSSVLISR